MTKRDSIQRQAEQQSQSSVFGVEDSFSQRNLQKTAADFDTMSYVASSLSFGNSRGIEKWLEFRLGDYFHLIGIVLFVTAFLEERKKGLWSIVRTCQSGRGLLGFNRVSILIVGSALCTVLFCGIPLLISLYLHGGWQDMGRTLQSIESFKTCTLCITVGSWLSQYFIVKIAVGVLIGLLLWCLLSSISNIQFSLPALSAMLVGEYAFYALLPVQSLLNV